jgi:hypothetical protein
VAVFLFSVLSLSLTYVAGAAMRGNSRSRDFAAATALATEKLEELESLGFDRLRPTNASDGPMEAAGAAGGPFHRRWSIEATSLNGLEARRLEVSVSWRGGGTVSLATLVVGIPEVWAGRPSAFVDSWNQVR